MTRIYEAQEIPYGLSYCFTRIGQHTSWPYTYRAVFFRCRFGIVKFMTHPDSLPSLEWWPAA